MWRRPKRRRNQRRRRSLFESLEQRLLLTADWQNPVDSRDVSGDGLVAPDDVLRVINFLNSEGIGELPTRVGTDQPYLDVTGDGFASSGDVLRLINLLNADVPTPYQLVEQSEAGSSGSIRIGLGQETGSRIYSFAVDATFEASDGGDSDRLEVYLVDPSNPDRTLLDAGDPGTPILVMEKDLVSYPEEIVHFDQGTVRVDLTSLADLAEGEMVFQLVSGDQGAGSRVAIHPLSNDVLQGLLLTNFPASFDGNVVTLEAEWLSGSGGFEEIGFIALDDESGMLDGMLPDDPGYADAVLHSASRQPLFSDQDAVGGFQEVQFSSVEWLGLYVFQHALEPSLDDHLVVRTTGDSIWEVGWEESESIWPGLPDLGNRGYDDAVFRVSQVSRMRPLDLEPIEDHVIDEETLLELALNAVGGESIAARRFELLDGPKGALLEEQSGVFRWTPTELQGPGTFDVSVRVVDGDTSDSEAFTVTVREVNSAPLLGPIGAQRTDEDQTLLFTATATDPDIPLNDLVFSLGVGEPAGATIDPSSGEFTWTPTEADGPGEYNVTVRVTDAGGLSDFENVAITVSEVNQPPELDAIENQKVDVGSEVTFTATATDPDLPPNELRFSLDAGAPGEASIDETTGRFVWTPAASDASIEHSVTVRVTDGGGLSDVETLTIVVSSVDRAPPVLDPISDQMVDEGQPLMFVVSATDADSPAAALQFSLAPGAPGSSVIDSSSGEFHWTPSESDGPGDYEVTVVVTDESGLTDSATVPITVREVNLPPILAVIGDRFVEEGESVVFVATATDPDLPANDLTFSLGVGAPQGAAIDSESGQFTWTPTGTGIFDITIVVTDNGSPPLSDAETISVTTDCPFDLSQWTTRQSGGTATGEGSVTGVCQANMHEGDSFLVEMQRTIIIPERSLLDLRFENLSFDLSDTVGVNDAFEAALVDARGVPLVHVFRPDRDAFLNLTEGQDPQTGAGTSLDQGVVTVDLSDVAAGTEATLILRLVNNDADTESRVEITDFELTPGAASGGTILVQAARQPTPPPAIDFELLSDVTASFQVEFATTSFDDEAMTLFADAALVNRGQFLVDAPLLLVIDEISQPSVRPIEFDGFTPDGKPYYEFTSLMSEGTLKSELGTRSQPIAFLNESEIPFTFEPLILAQLNHAPEFVSEPVREVLSGMQYKYDSDAVDRDDDALTYELITGPQDMMIDSASGEISWSPTASDAGTHTVLVRVDDSRGGIDEQDFSVEVLENPSNRPPIITSEPVVSSVVGTPYEYLVTASDPDQDPIEFRLQVSPAGMAINATTGLIEWTPDVSQLGEQPVTVSASDGRGGSAGQTFSVRVGADPTNRPPIIISDPVTVFNLPGMVNPATGDVSPKIIKHDLAIGGTATETVALTLSDTGLASADIVFVVDESESMQGEHAWMAEMIPQLEEALLDKGIGPNRYAIVGFGGFNQHVVSHFHNLNAGSSFFLYDSENKPLDSEGLEGVLTPILIDATFPATDDYVLVVAGHIEGDEITYGFRPVFSSTTTTPVAFGEVVEGSIDVPGDIGQFTFTLAEPTDVLFDVMSFQFGFSWTIEGPSGVVAADDFGFFYHNELMLGLPVGDYTVTVEAPGDFTGDYYFRLLDVHQAGTQIELGTPVTDSLVPSNSTNIYQFEVENPGERYFFDIETYTTTDTTTLSNNPASTQYRLIDPRGRDVFDNSIAKTPTFSRDRDGVVLPLAGTYTVLFEGKGYALGQADYTFAIYGFGDEPQPLVLGERVDGEIGVPGEEGVYGFTLDTPSQLYFDSFTDDVRLHWSLDGPDGRKVDQRELDRSDGRNNPDSAAVLELAAGDYQLTIDVFNELTLPYAFRMLDLATATPLMLSQEVVGELSPANETDFYRFDAAAGDSFFFDFVSVGSGDAIWRLADPSGRILFQNSFLNSGSDEDRLTLANTGTYTVMIEGQIRSVGTTAYSFAVHPVTPDVTPLTLDAVTTGEIATPGAVNSYSFTLSNQTFAYFDSLTDNAEIHWTLTGPSGTVVSQRALSASDSTKVSSPILNLVAGEYALVLDGEGDATGRYEFRLGDIASAASITPGTPVSGELNPANETDLYQFAVSAGDMFAFDSQGGTVARTATWRLIDPFRRVVFSSAFANDVDAMTLNRTGNYTLLIEEQALTSATGTYEFDVEFLGNTPPEVVTGAAMTLGDVVNGSIDAAGERDVYAFNLPTSSLLYFDSLTNSSSHRWTLTGPAGAAVSSRPFSSSDAGRESAPSILNLVPGDYVLIVTAANAAGAYGFQLSDLAAAAPIDTGTPVNGELDPANQTELYSFDAVAGEPFYFESQEIDGPRNARWRLVDPYGRIVFDNGLRTDVARRRLELAGTYTLLVEGRAADTQTGTYQFTVHRFSDTPEPLTLGDTVLESISVPGEVDRYSFSLASESQVYFDSLTGLQQLTWTLSGPAGRVVNAREFSRSESGPLRLAAGDYTLTVDGTREAIADYGFRLSNLKAATQIFPGSATSGTLSPGNETHLYRFSATAGESFFFDYLDASLTAANWRLIDPLGTTVFSTFFGNSVQSDVETIKLEHTGDYTLMMEGVVFRLEDNFYSFNVQPVADHAQPLVLGDTTAGSIGVPGEQDHYTFSLTSPTHLYFDALAGPVGFTASLFGPAGTVLDPAALSRDDGVVPAPLQGLEVGEYTLTIDTSADGTGDYEFRLLDLSTAPPLSLGQTLTNTLSPGSESDAYSFTASEGQTFFFDWAGAFGGTARDWTLIDPYGQIVFDRPTAAADPSITLGAAGVYVLIVEGTFVPTESEYTLTVQPTTVSSAPLAVGITIEDAITNPGDEDQYVFSLTEPTRVYFDALSGGRDLSWQIHRPTGAVVAEDLFDAGAHESRLIELSPGDYTLTVDAVGDTTESYAFQLIDIDSAPTLTPGTPVSGALSPGSTTDAYSFDAVAGERYLVEVLSWTGSTGAIWRMLDPNGVVVGTSGLRRASDRLQFTQTGSYTLLVEGAIRDTVEGAYEITVHSAPVATLPLTLGETIDGEITTPGMTNQYRFSLDSPAQLYFDSLTTSSFLTMELTGPNRILFNTFGGDEQVFNAVSGDYTLDIEGNSATAAYQFRLLDLANAEPLPRETIVSGTLDPANETHPFRFAADAGDRFSLEVTNRSGANQARWRLVSPFGTTLQSGRLDPGLIDFSIPQPGTYTLLIIGASNNTDVGEYSIELRFEENVPIPPVVGTPLTLETTVVGSIAEAGELDFYTFRVDTDTRGYFDSLTNSGRLFWQISGPAGIVGGGSFNSSSTLTNLVAGDYAIRIAGQGSATGDYEFRMLDLASAALIAPDEAVFATLDPSNSTQAFRFNATAGERYLFDVLTSSTSAAWRLIDPFGNEVFSGGFSDMGSFTLERTGSYTLLVEGPVLGFGTTDYGFRVVTVDRVVEVGEIVNGSISLLNENHEFIFHGRFGQRLYFDALHTTSNIFIRLISPSGEQVLSARTIRNTGPFTLRETGQYRLTAGSLFNTGDYSFQLLDLSSATRLSPNDLVEGTLDPALESDLYLISGSIGERFQIVPDDQMLTGSAIQASISARDTLIAAGSIEDGYATIDFTLDQDPFRIGTAKNLILVSDEDRDVFDTRLGFGDIFSSLDSQSIRLNLVNNAVLRDGEGNRALGVDANGIAYREAEEGGFTTSAGGTYVSGFGTTKEDYVDMAWALDGAVFDLNLLRAGGNVATSFSNAFVDYKAGEIQAQFQVDLIASDPNAPFENLTGQLEGLDGTVSFDARLTGDGAAHSFDLQVVLAGTGVVLGTVPVILNVEYAYPVRAIDPDGDLVTYSLLEAPDGATIDEQTGHIDWEPDVPGNYDFLVQALDGRGGEDTQRYTVAVTAGQVNEDPLITSTPLTEATVGRPYSYTVTSDDPDGHTTSYFTTTAPDGLTIDRTTGEVTWTPTELQIGTHPLTVQVRDGFGGQVLQEFDIEVVEDSDNEPPEIVSEPVIGVISGQPYRYRARAIDPNADRLSYDLVVAPPGMSVDASTGLVAWRPSATQAGEHNVFLRVTDGRDGVGLQAFQVTVVPANTSPVITSQPRTPAVAGHAYVYPVDAQDAESDSLAYNLSQAPDGMTIDANSGLISWTPAAEQVGSHFVTVTGDDLHGGQVAQSFVLQVVANADNRTPTITSMPRDTIALGQTYLYAVAATDLDHDALSYSLLAAPVGMSVTSRGLIRWEPAPEQFGANSVQLQVADGRGGQATQNFNVAVTSLTTNRAPVIVSTPHLYGTVDEAYEYQLEAIDPEGDPLAWVLDQAPMGMSINPALGTIRWTPSILQTGRQDVVVRVIAVQGGTSTQRFSIDVRAANLPPIIDSVPPIDATAGAAYSYLVSASDAENDPLSYSLALAPIGMSIDSTSGLIEWQPDFSGVAQVSILVEDDQGGAAMQDFDLIVHRFGINRAPRITSFPRTKIFAGVLFEYQLEAVDPEGAAVDFSFGENLSDFEPLRPEGLVLDTETGLVQWIPALDQVGVSTVSLVATDPDGSHGIQIFEVRVFPADTALTIGSLPVTSVTAGATYRYDVEVSDTSGALVTYTLASAPAEMEIDQLGRISWPTDIDSIGLHSVELLVENDRGLSVAQNFELTVVADAELPKISLSVSPSPADLGDAVKFVATASDNVGVVDLMVTLDGVPLALDAMGSVTVTMTEARQFDIVATAIDAAGNVEAAASVLNVIDRSDVNAPVVSISSPVRGEDIASLVEVIGTVTDDTLLFYSIEVAAVPSGEFKEIFRGTGEIVDGVLGELDPTLLRNDSYRLRVSAQDSGGNRSRDEVLVHVSGNLKVGNFSLSFTDLSLPVAGVPLTIVRTYDSLGANVDGELGFGWSMDFLNVDIRSSVRSTGLPGFFEPFRDGTRVYVTLPSGTREGFTFEPALDTDVMRSIHGWVDIYEPTFVPDPGVTSELTVEDAFLVKILGSSEYRAFGQSIPYSPFDPLANDRYVLTNKFGVEYRINPRTSAIEQIKTPPGDTLDIGRNGIVSSDGPQLLFERDARGRIRSVIDPAGNSIDYTYDDSGDLVAVNDREGVTTEIKYESPIDHYLTEVIDPLGRTGFRTEYDEDGRVARVFDADGNPTVYEYLPDENTERIFDSNGNPTTYTYDDRGNVLQIVDALGGVTKYEVDANNNVTSLTNPLGNTSTYAFDDRGNQISASDAHGNTVYQTYMKNSQLATIVDPLGFTTTFSYDSAGNNTGATDALGQSTTLDVTNGRVTAGGYATGASFNIEYDASGNMDRRIGVDGTITEYAWDDNRQKMSETSYRTIDEKQTKLTVHFGYDREGRSTSVILPDETPEELGDNPRIAMEYNAIGQVTASVDELGRRTEFEYDLSGQRTGIVYPDGLTELWTYDTVGNNITYVNRGGGTYRYEFDQLNRLVKTIAPDDTPADLTDNPVSETVYDAAGQVIAEIDPSGNRTDFEYDAAGRLDRMLLPEVLDATTDTFVRPTFSYEYDMRGQLQRLTEPAGGVWQFEYDAAARLTATTNPLGNRTSKVYDELGRVLTAIDALGRTTSYTYDARGLTTSVTLPAAKEGESPPVYRYEYDEAGLLIKSIDPLGRETVSAYDIRGQMVEQRLPGGQQSSAAYDDAGNLIRSIDFNGQETLYEYDSLNRMVRQVFDDGAEHVLSYTANNGRQSIQTPEGTASYEYDALDRLVSVTDVLGQDITYEFNPNGLRTAITTDSGTTRYDYAAGNRLSTVTDPTGAITTYGYDASGNLVNTVLPNGTTETREYNLAQQLTFVGHQDTDNNVIDSFSYIIDAAGRRASTTHHGGRQVSYVYDNLNRLMSELIIDPTAGDRTISYEYDLVGNRLSRDDSVAGGSTYRYDVNDRLLTEVSAGVTTTYNYNDNGALTSKETGPNDRTTFSWDARGRMSRADILAGGATSAVEYTYGANGVMVARSVDGAETKYLVDSNRRFAQVIEERTDAQGVTASYVHGMNLISQTRGASTAYYHADGLGTIRALSGAAGRVTDTYTHDAFGRLLGSSGVTANDYGFAGERRDPLTGLDYLRARHLDSNTGRFVSVDPLAGDLRSPLTTHSYTYVSNNPVNLIDPSGQVTLPEVSLVSSISQINSALATASQINRVCSFLASLDFLVDAMQVMSFFSFLSFNVSDFLNRVTDASPQSGSSTSFGFHYSWQPPMESGETLANGKLKKIGVKATAAAGKLSFSGSISYQGFPDGSLGFSIIAGNGKSVWEDIKESLEASVSTSTRLKKIHLCKRGPPIGEINLGLGVGTSSSSSTTASASAKLQLKFGIFNPATDTIAATVADFSFSIAKAVVRPDGSGRLDLGGITVIG